MTSSHQSEIAKERSQLAGTPWRMSLLIGAVGIATVGMVAYGFHTGVRMNAMYAPLVGAAIEIKLEATTAHLCIEEIARGNRHEDVEGVWTHLDQAEWYTKAMLEGGTNLEGTFIPLENAEMRRETRKVQEILREFRDISRQRLGGKEEAGLGSDIDQRYDAVFAELIHQADEVETTLQRVMDLDLRRFRATQIALIVVFLFLFIAIETALYRFEGRRAAVARALYDTNKSLAVEITDRKRAEETLQTFARQQAIVAELGQFALAGVNLSDLMNETVKRLAAMLDVEYCEVLELLPDGKAVLLRAGVGWKKGLVGRARVPTGLNSQAGYTLHSATTVVVEDLRPETRFTGPALLHDHHVVSGMSVVIQGQKHPWGVLGAHTTRRRSFSKDDVNFLRSAANVLGEAIAREQAEEALRESEHTLRDLFENANDFIFILRPDGSFLFSNRAWQETLGYSSDDLASRTMFDLLHEESKNDSEQMFGRLLAGVTTVRTGEVVLVAKDGRSIVTEGNCSCRTKAGKVDSIRGILRDITERKRAEEQRKRYQDGLAKLDGSVRELLLVESDAGQFYSLVCDVIIQLVDADLSCLPLVDALGENFTYVAAAGAKAELLQGRTMALQGGGLCGWVATHGKSLSVSDLTLDSRVIPALARQLGVSTALLTPLMHKDKVIGGLSAFRDGKPFDEVEMQVLNLFGQRVSAALDNLRLLVTLERRVEERTADLQVANEELESFTYSVSHDLRAPLRHVDGYIRILLDEHAKSLDGEAQRYLNTIRNSAQKMGMLVDDLLALSRLGRKEVQKQIVDCNQLVREVWDEVTNGQDAARIEFELNRLPEAQADMTLIRQVWANLLDNAIKYSLTGDAPRVVVDSHSSDGLTWYRVRDNGVGFDARYADKLFGVFQRLHREEDFPGTGIGLAIVQRIVHKHGGQVRGDGEVGKGAIFEFMLGT